MARILFLMFVLVIVNGHKHHPKFPKLVASEETEQPYKKVACNSSHDRLRNEIIEKSRCGEPKEVFVELKLPGSYLQVMPSSVWVKRCVGLCDYDGPGSQCVRIFNLKTNKESCSTIDVEEHEACGCCTQNCPSPKVFNPPQFEYEVESV
ncbi:unnamed protein product [Leptidea sinapis]|uniref:Platelet-derived growth factor (PDGF) family profile domain-containing protein n=1 Tax=Leptidea sinapis TaxID=189913 RepID=A0A5E4Q123_9NEOP|nr:unnamed protein product [Leptidea sinapis]